ncbi:TPA: hypothetical protein ACRL9Z_001757 [Pseudomonas aeruginosa]
MNDRTLLELAARAAGMNIQRSRLDDPLHRDFLMNGEGVRNPGQCSFPWNPLTDDGDALRLAMTLELGVVCKRQSDPYEMNRSVVTSPYRVNQIRITEPHQDDPASATRRAIVRAAAEIGKSITQPGATSSP